MTVTAEHTTTAAATGSGFLELTGTVAHLADQIGWVASHLPARPAIPVLAALLLEADEDGVRITGTDYDTWAQADLGVSVTGQGRVALPGRLLAALLAKLPLEEPVTLTIDPARVRVRCGQIRATLRTLPVEDYPTCPAWPDEIGQAQAAELTTLLSRVAPAASTEALTPQLCGVHLRLGEGIEAMATDRYRVATATAPWEPTLDTGQDELQVTVPAQALTRAAKALSGMVAVGATRAEGGWIEAIGLADRTRRLSLRVLDGEFPHKAMGDYQAITRERAVATVEVTTTALAAAADRAGLFTGDDVTPIQITIEDAMLIVAGSGADGDDADEALQDVTIDLTDQATRGMRLAFQPRWLLPALEACRTERVRMIVAAPDRGVVITPATDSQDQEDAWFLVMPVRQGGRDL